MISSDHTQAYFSLFSLPEGSKTETCTHIHTQTQMERLREERKCRQSLNYTGSSWNAHKNSDCVTLNPRTSKASSLLYGRQELSNFNRYHWLLGSALTGSWDKEPDPDTELKHRIWDAEHLWHLYQLYRWGNRGWPHISNEPQIWPLCHRRLLLIMLPFCWPLGNLGWTLFSFPLDYGDWS